MQYYIIDEMDELRVVQLNKKLKGYYESPIDAIEVVLDIEKRCLENEEYAVAQRKNKINKLQNLLDDYMNAKLRF